MITSPPSKFGAIPKKMPSPAAQVGFSFLPFLPTNSFNLRSMYYAKGVINGKAGKAAALQIFSDMLTLTQSGGDCTVHKQIYPSGYIHQGLLLYFVFLHTLIPCLLYLVNRFLFRGPITPSKKTPFLAEPSNKIQVIELFELNMSKWPTVCSQHQQHHDGDKVRIFVAGPSPRMEKKSVRKITNSAAAFYKSAGPNDERFYGKSMQCKNQPLHSL